MVSTSIYVDSVSVDLEDEVKGFYRAQNTQPVYTWNEDNFFGIGSPSAGERLEILDGYYSEHNDFTGIFIQNTSDPAISTSATSGIKFGVSGATAGGGSGITAGSIGSIYTDNQDENLNFDIGTLDGLFSFNQTIDITRGNLQLLEDATIDWDIGKTLTYDGSNFKFYGGMVVNNSNGFYADVKNADHSTPDMFKGFGHDNETFIITNDGDVELTIPAGGSTQSVWSIRNDFNADFNIRSDDTWTRYIDMWTSTGSTGLDIWSTDTDASLWVGTQGGSYDFTANFTTKDLDIHSL